MEGVKRKASNNWSWVFQIALKSAEGGWKFCLEKFWPFSAFVILQIRFCNHRVIKSSMIYLYIKPEVIKMIQQQRCSNKSSLYWVITWKLLFGEKTFSGVGNDLFFWVLDEPNLKGFPQTVGLGEEVGQSIPGGDNKQDEGRANIFGKTGKTDLILKPLIQLSNLIPMNIFQ